MTCTYRTGVASSTAGAQAMAVYVSTEMLQPERAELARYYAGEFVPEPQRELTPTEQLARELNQGAVSFSEALDLLMQAEIAANRGRNFDFDAAEDRLANQLLDAATRADFASEVKAGRGTIGQVRPDLSPAFATRLGIDQRQPLTLNGLANLLNGRRVDGEEIAGRRRRSATMSIADVFGLDPKAAPGGDATRNILAGLRVDGKTPTNDRGEELSGERVAGVRRRWLSAMGVPSHREPNAEEIAHLIAGKMANGANINTSDYRRAMNATRERVAYIDLTFSADKSLTIAWALAPTEGERAMLLQVHKDAVADAMKHVEHELGLARRGDGGKDGVERGELAWISFQHYTSRPTVEIARKDTEGRPYTELRDVPLRVGDPQLHTHVMLLNAVQTVSGRLGSIDLDRLDGAVKEFGAVFTPSSPGMRERTGSMSFSMSAPGRLG
jgi:TrwC relaxase